MSTLNLWPPNGPWLKCRGSVAQTYEAATNNNILARELDQARSEPLLAPQMDSVLEVVGTPFSLKRAPRVEAITRGILHHENGIW